MLAAFVLALSLIRDRGIVEECELGHSTWLIVSVRSSGRSR